MAWEPIFPNGNPALTDPGPHDCRPGGLVARLARCVICSRPMQAEVEAEAKARYLARHPERVSR